MGGDGGTALTSRKDMLSTASGSSSSSSASNTSAASASGLNDKERIIAKFTCCSLSGDTLRMPVVACKMGRLFNKDTLIMALINKSPLLADSFQHIRALKDVTTCVFTERKKREREGSDDIAWIDPNSGEARFMCPFTQVEFNGRHPFSFLWDSGLVISNRALTSMPIEIVNPNNEHVVLLFPQAEEDIAAAKLWIETMNVVETMKKKKKRSRKVKEEESNSVEEENQGEQPKRGKKEESVKAALKLDKRV